MDNCVFCRIVEVLEPASVVYADEKAMAFMDLQPVNPGHLLVIPKLHFACLSDLPLETGSHMLRIAMRLAEALRQSGIRCEGINLFLADGEAAFQEIFHVHLHVIPRFSGDGFGLKFGPKYGFKPPGKELDDIAQKIRMAMSKHM